jgi:hypothetical protein
MQKFLYSKTFKLSQSALSELSERRNNNSPYSKTLNLQVGEAFVIYGRTRSGVPLPYGKAKKKGIKFITKSNYRIGDKSGLLVTRIA